MSDGKPDGFESLIANAHRGWEFFEGIDPKIRQMIEVRQADNDQKARRIAATWARFAATADGREALDAMFDMTHRRVTFFVQLGLPMDQIAMWGVFREGQKATAQEIARQIAKGRGDEPPKPRETT